MEKSQPIIVIIPAYNEALSIGTVIEEAKRVLPSADIVVINDCSKDNSAEIAREAGALVVSLLFQMGYGTALQTGFKFAMDKGYDYLVQLDADGQHDPKDIPKLLDPVLSGSVDLVIGSRFLGKVDYRTSFSRRLGMIFFGKIASFFAGQRITDPTSGFQALNRKVFEFLASDRYPVDFPDADVLIMLHRAGFKIAEVPVIMKSSISKKSMHSGLKPVYYIFKMLLSIFVTLLRRD